MPEPLPYALGEIAGSITASGLMVHLYRSIDIELDLPEKKAVSHPERWGLYGSAIEIGVLVGSFFFQNGLCHIPFGGAACKKGSSTYGSMDGKNKTS